jgi:hypothetical protein
VVQDGHGVVVTDAVAEGEDEDAFAEGEDEDAFAEGEDEDEDDAEVLTVGVPLGSPDGRAEYPGVDGAGTVVAVAAVDLVLDGTAEAGPVVGVAAGWAVPGAPRPASTAQAPAPPSPNAAAVTASPTAIRRSRELGGLESQDHMPAGYRVPHALGGTGRQAASDGPVFW